MTESTTATNWFNAAFLVNPDGLLTAKYHKQKLVIFGEYVPLEKTIGFIMNGLHRLTAVGRRGKNR